MMDTAELVIAGKSVSRETFMRLRELETLVRRWSPAINLVSKSTLSDIWERHIVDSAQIFWLSGQPGGTWVDLGSGGGFPGLVIATLAQGAGSNLAVTLVESDRRKATFLRQAANILKLPVSVQSDRIELLKPQEADFLSARALAALPDLLGYAKRHLKPEGLALLPKGGRHSEEIEEAERVWSFDLDVTPSLSDSSAAILMIRNIHRAQH